MNGLAQFWAQSDNVGRSVALLLLAMSVTAWVLILWKGWLLRRAASDIARAVPAFWAAPGLEEAKTQLAAIDRVQVLVPLLAAGLHSASAGTLEAAVDADRASLGLDETGAIGGSADDGVMQCHARIRQVQLAIGAATDAQDVS